MIGTDFCSKLCEEKVMFSGIDKKRNRWNSYIDRSTWIRDLTKKFEFGHGSYDMVVHLAANARVFDLVKDPDLARDNMIMTYNILEFVRKSGIKEFIFASSREVYGNAEGSFVYKEGNVSLDLCESPYTASKFLGEALVHAYCRCYGINFIIVRFSNVYGRYDYNDRVVPLFIAKALRNLPLEVYGENKILDFTYIDDAIDGLYLAVERFEKGKNKVYNIAGGKGYSITDVAKKIKSMAASNSEIIFKDSRMGEVEKFVADISKARNILGYEPKYSINLGLLETMLWYRPRLAEYLECLNQV